MLYLTTRNNNDAFTAHHALHEQCGADGGRYVPFRLPVFNQAEIDALADKTFGQIVAEMLNSFFSSRLNGWDVDCCIGRNASTLATMQHRIVLSVLWRNPAGKYDYIVKKLYKAVLGQENDAAEPSEWFKFAVQIAVMFAIYGQMRKAQELDSEELFDVCVLANDFSTPMAAWYARKMGLPVGTIVCVCENDSTIWDTIQRGTFNTIVADNNLKLGFERLVHATLGCDEVEKYRNKCEAKQFYNMSEEDHNVLREGFFCSVVGQNRTQSLINSVFRTNSYIFAPSTAVCFGGLQDYRAKTGANKKTLLIATDSPMSYASVISDATGIPSDKLTEYTNYC